MARHSRIDYIDNRDCIDRILEKGLIMVDDNEQPEVKVDEPVNEIEQSDENEQSDEPEPEVEEPREPGFHVLHALGHLLGVYPTREDAQAFVDGHYPDGTIEHVTG